MAEHKTFWKEFWRTVKYFLVAGSAGLIQTGVLFLLSKAIGLNEWLAYFIALVISVIWNFTINRKVTFKSVGNIPIAMLKVIGYYLVFTPLSVQFLWLAEFKWFWSELALTFAEIGVILFNGVTEYIFMRLFVFRKEIDTAPVKEKKHKKTEIEQSEEGSNAVEEEK